MANKYLDENGLLYFFNRVKQYVAGVLPTKTSDLTNDSGFITTNDIPEGAAASTTTPAMDGIASVGSELAFARGDHVHPTDTSRASAAVVSALQTTVAGKADSGTSLSDYGILDAYTKTETASYVTGLGYQTSSQVQDAITSALSSVTSIRYEIVTDLPQTGEAGVIYLKSNGGSSSNIYDEYIYYNNRYEKIGTTDVDLSGYMLTTDMVAITNSEINTIVSGSSGS